MTLFSLNSITAQKTPPMVVGIGILCFLGSLWLRGKFWRYVAVLGLETFVAFVAVMAFPIMEMVLEEILKEKLRKVGDKVRANAKRMEEYYANQSSSSSQQ